MARKAVYLLVTKSGPTAEQQLALIRKKVKLTKADEIYTDDTTEKYRRKDAVLEQRNVLERQLRRGDIVVVATPGCVGVGRDDIRGFLIRRSKDGHGTLDASSGKIVIWTDEVADALEFLDRATLERRRRAAETAREVKMALGHTYIPEEKALAVSDEQAKIMWYDPIGYPSRKEVARLCGVSDRTLHNRYGSRTGKKRKRK